MKPSPSSYQWSSCSAAMACSPLYFMNFTSTRYRERLILYSLYPILRLCSFSKSIACCITCHWNGTGSFSLISPDISLLNSKVSLHPATPQGLVSSSVYEIFFFFFGGGWGHPKLHPRNCHERFYTRFYTLPHCCLSL